MYQRIGWTALRLFLIWVIIYWLVACTEKDVALPGVGTSVSPTSVASTTDKDGAGPRGNSVLSSMMTGNNDLFVRDAVWREAREVSRNDRHVIASPRYAGDVDGDGADDLIDLSGGLVVVVYGAPIEDL